MSSLGQTLSPWCHSFHGFNSSPHWKYSITAFRSFTFLFRKIKYGHTEPTASREIESLSREGILGLERCGLSCIPHLAVSQQAKPLTTFPCRSGRQAATSCMMDRNHPRACKFLLPLQTVCLSFLSHVCSPAAHAQGNEEDALSPWANSWVSVNWSLLLLSQYNSVA